MTGVTAYASDVNLVRANNTNGRRELRPAVELCRKICHAGCREPDQRTANMRANEKRASGRR